MCDQRTAAEETPRQHNLAIVDEVPVGEASEGVAPEAKAPEGDMPEGVAPETKAPEGEAPEDAAPLGEALEVEVPEDSALEDMSPEDVASKNIKSKHSERKYVVRKYVTPKYVPRKYVGRKHVPRKLLTGENETLKEVAPENVVAEEVLPEESDGGDWGTELKNAMSSASDAICKGNELVIAQLREHLAERNRRESELLTELTQLMDDYTSLDQTLATVKGMNVEYARKIEEHAQEVSALQSTVGTLKCREIEREEQFEALKQKQVAAMECSVCLCVLLRPITLSCGHTFCQKCVEDVKGAARLEGYSAKCPLCREPTQHAVRSAVLDELAEIIRQFEAKACNLS